jgi:4-amino-4-deoxy-L-arabinose transferase-like glycosyltransferase
MSKQSLPLRGKKWFRAILVLSLIVVFAFAIRIYHLTILPVFADEAIYIRWSQVMGAEATLRFLPLSDGKQPLFMWVLMFIVRRFSDPLFISRLLSIFCGIGSVVGIFALTQLLFKTIKISLLAAFFWAICPIAFFFDRMALVDSMLAMFGVWTLFFAVLTAKLKRLDMAMIGGFMLGFALLTKSPALFFTILIPTTWIYAKNFKELIKIILLTLVTFIIGYAMYNILRLGPDFATISSRNQDYIFPISHLWTNPKDPFIFHISEIFTDWFTKMGPGAGLILAVIGILVGFKKYFRETLIVFAWFFVPLIIQSEYAKVFTVRYVLMTIPFFVILCAISLLQTKVKYIKPISLFLIFIFVIQALLFDKSLVSNPEAANLPFSERSGYLEEWSAGQGVKEAADYIKNQYATNPSKQIVVGTEGYFGTLPDGLQIYLNSNPKIIIVGTGLNFSDVPSQLKAAYKNGDATYFVVNSDRIQVKQNDYERLGLKLITSYPKAIRREHESHEYVQFGPQESLLFFQIVEPVNGKPAKI